MTPRSDDLTLATFARLFPRFRSQLPHPGTTLLLSTATVSALSFRRTTRYPLAQAHQRYKMQGSAIQQLRETIRGDQIISSTLNVNDRSASAMTEMQSVNCSEGAQRDGRALGPEAAEAGDSGAVGVHETKQMYRPALQSQLRGNAVPRGMGSSAVS